MEGTGFELLVRGRLKLVVGRRRQRNRTARRRRCRCASVTFDRLVPRTRAGSTWGTSDLGAGHAAPRSVSSSIDCGSKSSPRATWACSRRSRAASTRCSSSLSDASNRRCRSRETTIIPAVQGTSGWRQGDQPLAVVRRVWGGLQQAAEFQAGNCAAYRRLVQSQDLRRAASRHHRLDPQNPHQPPFRQSDAEMSPVETRAANRQNVRDRADQIADRLSEFVDGGLGWDFGGGMIDG